MNGREICDDGNTINHDGCSDDCLTCVNIICGDGIPEGNEQCDDANQNDNDACRNSCMDSFCGDGAINPSTEQCDDGNALSADGCSNTCQIEIPPAPVCGNNVLEAGEQFLIHGISLLSGEDESSGPCRGHHRRG